MKRRILVVDDAPQILSDLVAGLSRDAHVVPCVSGEEAVGRVKAEPGAFAYAVIDQVLRGKFDGIETCQQIADISRDIFILVFTNVPAVDQSQLEEHRARAFAAGAHRYLERASEAADLLSVTQFVEEMQQLAQLRARISEFYDERLQIPSLLTQLDLGIDIVDRFYKVWFMNDAMRRITGVNGAGLPRPRCSAWHDYQLCPCPGCLVTNTLRTGVSCDRIFLSPIKGRGEGLFYLHVWAQAVKNDCGDIMLASNGKPLAVMETVQDLTNTGQLQAMSLDDRLKIIAHALHERLRPGYARRQPFQRIVVYAVDPEQPASDRLQMRALGGYDDEAIRRYHLAPFEPKQVKDFQTVIENMQATGWGYFSSDDSRVDPIDGRVLARCVYWPVLNGGRKLIAFVRASGADCEESDVSIVGAYARAVADAIEQCRPPTGQLISLDAERLLARIDNKLQTIGSPEAALRYLLTEGCNFTGSHLGHVRYRKENHAVLLRLSPHTHDAYERVAILRWPLDHLASWSARTILSGIEQHRNDLSQVRGIVETERESLSSQARRSLDTSRSFCFEPLIFENRCIGAIGFHSEDVGAYIGDKLLFLRQIARRASLVLHDFLAKLAADEQLESLQASTVETLLHNINTPLGTLRNCVQLLRVESSNADNKALKRAVIADTVENACDRIGRIREDFARLLQMHVTMPSAVNLHKSLRKWVTDEMGNRSDVDVFYELDDRLTMLITDDVAARSCVEVLVRNSLDEFDRLGPEQKHTLRVALRPPDDDESGWLATADGLLAIEVQDNGPGLPEDKRESLFQIIRSTKPSSLGIGLVCCRRMARSAGGDVFLKRTGQVGATFVTILPYQNPAPDPEP